MKMISIFVLLLTFQANTVFAFQQLKDADYYCKADGLEVGIFYDRDTMIESGVFTPFIKPIFSDKNYIIIVRKGDDTSITLHNLIATTDGAGNDSFQVLALGAGGFEIVAEMTYEHEGGYIAGYFKEPIRRQYPLCEYGESCKPIVGFQDKKVILDQAQCEF